MAGVFTFGDALISQRRWQADQERLAQRDAWEREDRAYRDSERKRVADARFSLENTISGMSGGSQAEIAASGYTPEQIATGMQARGGARQFAEQVAKYQGDFDSSDLQSGGAGERVAAGLPLQGARVDPSTVKAPRKSELAGARAKYALAMGQDPGAALADQDAALTQERMKDWFSQFEKLSNEKLLEHPALAAMLNGNAAVRGAVGLRSDGKTYTISDYNGSGRSEDFTRDELMQAAYQRFLESEGHIPESIALGIGRTDRKRTRNREDVRDTNEGQKLAFDMNLGNAKFGLAQEELRDNRNFRNQSLGLQREGLGLRRREMDSQDWVPIGATGDDRGLTFFNRRTAAVESRQLPQGQSGKDLFARITGNRGAKPIDEQTVMGYVEQLRADPNHQGKNVFELRQMVLDSLQGGAGQAMIVPGGGRPDGAPAPTAGTTPPEKPVSDGRKNFGILTSRADLEREVAAGNPYAIRYMDAQRENRINAELAAGNPNYGINY